MLRTTALNIIPGWVKILLLAACLGTLVWSIWEREFSFDNQENPRALLVPPKTDLEHGLAGKIRNNVRQFASNPLERPPKPSEAVTVVREAPENYYRDNH